MCTSKQGIKGIRNRLLIASIMFLIILFPAYTPGQREGDLVKIKSKSEVDVSTLKRAAEETISAYNSGDLAGQLAYLADDVQLMEDFIPTIVGKERIRPILERLNKLKRQLIFSIDEIVVEGNMAYISGNYAEILKDKKTIQRFLQLWRKKTDGNWEVFRIIQTGIKPDLKDDRGIISEADFKPGRDNWIFFTDPGIEVKKYNVVVGSLPQPGIKIEIPGKQEYLKSFIISLDIPVIGTYEHIEKDKTFKSLIIPGWLHQGEVGKPAVPIKPIHIEIPGNCIPRVKIIEEEKHVMDDILVYPAQPPKRGITPDEPQKFKINRAFYKKDTLFPAGNVFKTSIVYMRNHRVLALEIAPVQANPKKHRVHIKHHLKLEVTLEPDEKKGLDRIEPGLADSHYDQVHGHGIYNFKDISTIEADITPGLTKYMVLLNDQFKDNETLAEFLDWKKQKGCNVSFVLTSGIPAAEPGAPTNEEIVSYMRGLPAEQYPTYLLIIGNQDRARGVAPEYFTTWFGGYTDLSITCRTASDWIPDLFAGRLPASNNQECTSMLQKVLEMDRNPPDTGMYDKVVVAGQIQASNNTALRLFCATADAVAAYFEQDAGGIDYFCERAVVNPNNADANCLWHQGSPPYPILWAGATGPAAHIGNRVYNTFVTEDIAVDRITGQVNTGIALLQHRDHGSVEGWGDPGFSYSNVNDLTNGLNRPIVFSINCLTGSYFKPNNFTMAWLTHPFGGAYAVISATDVSFSGYNDWLTHGFYMGFLSDYRTWHNESLYPDWPSDLPASNWSIREGQAVRLGQILNFGKHYMYQHYGAVSYCNDTYKLFHLFGDPESYIQLHQPENLDVHHESRMPTGLRQYVISTSEDDCTVCLYSQELGIQQAKKTESNMAVFEVNAPQPGTIQVTVAKYGRRPYIGNIDVVADTAEIRELPVLDETHKSLIRKMIASTKPGKPTQLNLADNDHYNFFKKQLELADRTPQKSPQFHKVLEKSREMHKLHGPPEVYTSHVLTVNEAGETISEYQLEPIQVITAFGSTDELNFKVSALSSVPQQPNVSTLILGLYDKDGDLISESKEETEYRSGEDIEVETSGALASREDKTTAIATYFYEKQDGTPIHGYITVDTSIAPTEIIVTDPIIHNERHPGYINNEIVVCLGRSLGNCDYAPVGGSGQNILIPISGSITFGEGENIDIDPTTGKPRNALCWINLTRPNPNQGGGCTLKSTVDFFGDPNTIANGNRLSWNLQPAHFEPNNSCLEPNSHAIYTFTVNLYVNQKPVFVSITNAPDAPPPPNPYYKKIPPMLIVWSCLADGTKVLMKDGSEKVIENLEAEDKIISNNYGTIRTVVNTFKGKEEEPMIRIRTNKAHSLLLSDGHPVVTEKGILPARQVKVGDVVLTRGGTAKIISVTREMFKGHVWNPLLNPDCSCDETKDNTFFANGILVGDAKMQIHYEMLNKHKPVKVLDVLPEEWHQDYLNDHLKKRVKEKKDK